MSLIEQLRTARQAKTDDARAKYFLVLRTKRPAHEILAAAECAGITEEQVTADARVLEEVQRLTPNAAKLPATIAARETAVRAYDAAQKELDEAKARLEPVAMQRALEARGAEEFERQTLQQVNMLRNLFESNPELLLADLAPKAVKDLVARDAASTAASAERIKKQRRHHAARERVESAQAALSATGRPHTYMGMRTALNGPAPEEHEKRITAAQAELAEAEEEEASAAADLEAPGK